MNKAIVPLLLLLGALHGCATNPVTGKQDFALVSESEEIEQGRRFHATILRQYGVYDDPALQEYVNRLGQQLAQQSHRAELNYHFTVLDSPDINAFALPGGYIYITRGIMAYLDSEAELAGVLGHEIGHVTARHSVRQQSGQLATSLLGVLIGATTGNSDLANLGQAIGTGIVRGYGREHELEADRLGAEYLHRSGYDPEVMLGVIGVLKDQEIYEKALAEKEQREPNIYHGVYSTHPRNDDRLKTVVRAAKKLSVKTYRDSGRDAYLALIDGTTWGPSIKQGVVSGSRFSHPELGIALDLPRGWKVINRPEFLQARDPDSSALLQIGLEALQANESLEALLRRLTRKDDLEVSQTASGVTANTRLRPPKGDFQPGLISAIALNDDQAITLLGTASEDQFDAAKPTLLAVNDSFTRLGPAQIEALKYPRLRIVDADTYPDFAALAGASSIGDDAEDKLRLLNRAFPAGDIGGLDRVKTVRDE